MTDKTDLVKSISDLLDKHFGATKNVEITKSLDEEKRKATFVVLAPEEVDGHGDIYSAEAIEKGFDSYVNKCNRLNVEHMFMIDDKVAEVVENYLTPVDFQLDDRLIKKGTWVQTWKIHNDHLWDLVKSGEFNGLSVQCKGKTEDLDE